MVLLVLGCTVLLILPGVLLIVSAFWKPPEPPPGELPVAQIADGHSRIADRRRSKSRAAWNAFKFALGAALVGFGGFMIKAFYDFSKWEPASKGRILRLRGKARLPEVVGGGGWSDGTVPRLDGVSAAEREVLAKAWLESARMEHASIAAFGQLGLHLAAFGAPSELVQRTHQAALDELRHARRCYALASAFGGAPVSAGPIRELQAGGGGPVDLVRLAVGTLVDGCVAEGIAADIAARGARVAEDPVVREALAMIAADEATHAALGWAVLAWTLEIGGDEVDAALSARVERLDDELAPRAPDFTGVAASRLAAHGLFDQETLGAIAMRRIRLARDEARVLLGSVRRAA